MITHEELIDICQEIGTVAESNAAFTSGLTVALACKPLEDMTVAELLDVIRRCRKSYNQYRKNLEQAGM